MSQPKKEPNGCGCANIPFSLIIVIFGGGYWWFSQKGNSDISKFLPQSQQLTIPILNPTPIASTIPTSASSKIFNIPSNPQPIASAIPVTAGSRPSNIIPNNQLAIKKKLPQTNWQKKVIYMNFIQN